MRGRASGLGARISSMVLLIALGHRTNHFLNECDLVRCKFVLLVEISVGPLAIPRLLRNPSVNRLSRMLRDLAEREKKSEESGPCVALDGSCFRFGARMHEYVGLGT